MINRSAKPLTSTCNKVDRSGNTAHDLNRVQLRSNVTSGTHRTPFSVISTLSLIFMWLTCASAPSGSSIRTSTMTVGSVTVSANGVKYFTVNSVYQGFRPQIIRVLEPTHPSSGKPRRILFVLPVEAGVDNTSSTWSDGLEELRLLDVQDRFNMTVIAPSFTYEPWYGDNVSDPRFRMESFIIEDLVPFGDTFAEGSAPQRYLIGMSKSGNGALFLILRHPGIFKGAAAWDAPAQLSDINAPGLSSPGALPMNFGTQANFTRYNIPSLISTSAGPFRQQNRLWISGDQAAWTADMRKLNDQLTAASIPHTWKQTGPREHSWKSGWLDRAVIDLVANGDLTEPNAGRSRPDR